MSGDPAKGISAGKRTEVKQMMETTQKSNMMKTAIQPTITNRERHLHTQVSTLSMNPSPIGAVHGEVENRVEIPLKIIR